MWPPHAQIASRFHRACHPRTALRRYPPPNGKVHAEGGASLCLPNPPPPPPPPRTHHTHTLTHSPTPSLFSRARSARWPNSSQRGISQWCGAITRTRTYCTAPVAILHTVLATTPSYRVWGFRRRALPLRRTPFLATHPCLSTLSATHGTPPHIYVRTHIRTHTHTCREAVISGLGTGLRLPREQLSHIQYTLATQTPPPREHHQHTYTHTGTWTTSLP